MKIIYLVHFSLFSILLQSSNAQTTPKDFRLCIEHIGCSDSVLKISKQELLKANKVIPNFSWLTIKSLIIYIGEGNYASEIITINVKGDEINDEAKKRFQRLMPGNLVSIEVEGYNKSGKRVPWAGLFLRITE